MWESPIDAKYGEVIKSFEDDVVKAVQKVGINVDKDELIKALSYDRNQYEKGYNDGFLAAVHDGAAVKHGRWEDFAYKLDRRFGRRDLRRSLCSNRADNFVSGRDDWWEHAKPPYCPNCGAKMDLEG